MNRAAPSRRGSPVARLALLALMALMALVAASPVARADAEPVPRAALTFDEANRAFAEGRYADAVAGFEAQLAARGPSAPLLFDLGNAELRDGRPVKAILAYERARLLDPRDPAIAATLVAARSAAGIADETDLLAHASHALATDVWTGLAVGGAWLAFAAAGYVYLTRRRSRIAGATAAAGVLVGAVAAVALVVAARDLHRGLVMDSTPVLVSPFAGAQSDGALAAGAPVELGPSRDDYVLVKDAHGTRGWVERTRVEPLIAGSGTSS